MSRLDISNPCLKIKNNYKINVYIEKGTSDVGIEELEKKILAYDDVRYVKFRSKEMVLNEMEKELGMSIRKGENPLYDSMLITFRNPENLKFLEEKLLKENNIIEVMYSEQSIVITSYSIHYTKLYDLGWTW